MTTPQPTSFRAMHIGDLHFWKIPLNPFAYLNKRLLGVANLVVGGRAKKFRQELAPRLGEQLAQLHPDLYLFSGDFSSTAAGAEFSAARVFLEPLVQKASMGAHSVPGNHDCYLRSELGGRTFVRHLDPVLRPVCATAFEMLPGGICLMQLNATTQNGLGSHGEISPKLLKAVTTFLEKAKGEISSIWFLCHFPAEDPPGVLKHDRGPQLRNCQPLLELLHDLNIPVMWLHGHHHYRWIYGSPKVARLTYLNAGAPFLRHGLQAPDMGFHELVWNGALTVRTHRFSAKEDRWIERDVAIPASGEYTDLQHWELAPERS